MNPHIYGQLIYNKGGKKYTMGKRQPLQQVVLGKLDSHMQNNEIGLLPYTIHEKYLKMD